MTHPILFCGDPHGQFRHIIDAVDRVQASAVVLLGDMEPQRPLHEELASVLELGLPLWFIHGNHDADSDELWTRVWDSEVADRNIHGRVVTLPGDVRLAGLGGVFRESVWYPSASAARSGEPAFRTRAEHTAATPKPERFRDSHPRRHFGSIYPQEVDALSSMRADILVTHEAPGYHPHGFELLDTLAQSLGAKVVIHGHHHDALDSSAQWEKQGFRSYGVGLRGISALWPAEGRWEVLVPGEQDHARAERYRTTWP